MQRRATTLVMGVIAAATLAGCASSKIAEEREPDADVSAVVSSQELTEIEQGAAPADSATTEDAQASGGMEVAGVDEQEPVGEETIATELRPFSGIVVRLEMREVEVQARVCWPSEPLEQVACALDSREHESLLSIAQPASHIHAAMLLAGYEPGLPGSWELEGKELKFVAPRGDLLDILVKYQRGDETVVHSIREWIVDEEGNRSFPESPWVFGGSQFRPNPEWMGPGEHYVADITGSIVGLVTFGDETIGFSDVISDLTALRAKEWFAALNTMPAEGASVTMVIRPYIDDERDR